MEEKIEEPRQKRIETGEMSPGSKIQTKLPPINSPPRSKAVETYLQEPKEKVLTALKSSVTYENAEISIGKSKLRDLFLGIFMEDHLKAKVSITDTIWEYVIVMENPDFNEENQNSITLETAEQLYKNCFKAKKNANSYQQTLGFVNEVTAFSEAFKTLNDFEEGKMFKNGGTIIRNADNEFSKQVGSPKDFLGLMANVITVKLVADLNLKVKSLLSTDGMYIFLIISADDEDLAKEAERIRYHKELEIGLTDIISLIPCDKANRPFHMLKFTDLDIKSLFKNVKEFFSQALELTKNTDKVDYKYEPVGVTPEQLSTYKQYLLYLGEGVLKIDAVSLHKHQMVLFKTLLIDCLDKANAEVPERNRLYNLWGRLGIPKPIAPTAEYRRPQASTEDELKDLWRNHSIDESGKRSLFKNIERIRLLASYIYTQINLNALVKNEVIIAHYPLHNNYQLVGKSDRTIENIPPDDKLLQALIIDLKTSRNRQSASVMESWYTGLFRQQIPLSKVRNYFGEKITLYFEFLRVYQRSLIFPSIIGIIVFIVQRSLSETNPGVLAVNAIYCIFITIWATVFLERWKRRESSMAVVWGQTEFEKLEIARPQFKGELRRSPITDDMEEVFYEGSKRFKYLILAASVTFVIICMVLAIVAGLIILKNNESEALTSGGIQFAGPLSSILNAIQIQIFNIIYSKLVKILTDLENHKTQNQYEDSLILKTFAFQFVNSFNSLVYIAFIKCEVGTSDSGVCREELFVQLISIFLVSYAKNLIELGLPIGKFYLARWRKTKANLVNVEKDPNDLRNDIEAQLYLEDYVNYENDGTIDDYMELAVQFGYITLFSLAFPLAIPLLFFGLWLEMLTDKLKLMKLVRRPIPLATKDIGTWGNIFSTICALSIISNTALFCFTNPTFKNWKAAEDNNYLIFVAIIAFLFIFRSQLMNWIPDVEEKYETVQRRHEFIVEKYLRGAPSTNVHEDVEMFDGTLYYSKSPI